MKNNKLLAAAVAAVFGASAANADIALTDNLTLSGYVDGSYSNLNNKTSADEENLGLDVAEVDFAFSYEKFSAQVHLDNGAANAANDDLRVEQAFGSYNLGNGLSLSAGRMNNTLGFEADEFPDMYQNSYAYDLFDTLNGQYSDGVRASYSSDAFALNLSGYEKLWAASKVSDADIDFAYEAQLVFTGVENLTVAIGYSEDDNSKTDTAKQVAARALNPDSPLNTEQIAEVFNVWAQYEMGQFKVAAEYSDLTSGAGDKADAWLILGNYAFSEKGAITLRYSEVDGNGGIADEDKFTVSPGYAITDNLWGLLEYSTGSIGGNDYDYFAVETTFTF
jgi:hypothetical protein